MNNQRIRVALVGNPNCGKSTILSGGGGLLDVPVLARQTVTRYNLSVDPAMLVAMAYIESGFKPDAFRWEPARLDASVGLMQTLKATAIQMFDAGYKAMGNAPDYTELRHPEISMYYGAAYVDWLKKWHMRRRGQPPAKNGLCAPTMAGLAGSRGARHPSPTPQIIGANIRMQDGGSVKCLFWLISQLVHSVAFGYRMALKT